MAVTPNTPTKATANTAAPLSKEVPESQQVFGNLIGAQAYITDFNTLHTTELKAQKATIGKDGGMTQKAYNEFVAEGVEANKKLDSERDKLISVFEEALAEEGRDPKKAQEIATRLEGLMNSAGGDTGYVDAFKTVNKEFKLNFNLSEADEDMLAEADKKAKADRQFVRQMSEDIKRNSENGGSLFRVFGFGLEMPTKSLSEGEFMKDADAFLQKAQNNGLIHLDPVELAWQKALLGGGTHSIASQNSVRSVVNIAITGVSEGAKPLINNFIASGKTLTSANWSAFLKDPKNNAGDLGDDIKQSAKDFLSRAGNDAKMVDFKVTSAERVRINQETYHAMADPKGDVMIGGVQLKEATLKLMRTQLENDKNFPNELIDKYMAKLGDPPTQMKLWTQLDTQIGTQLASMWTHSKANAESQRTQLPPNMNYKSSWETMGGGIHLANKESLKYVILEGQTAPEKNYVAEKLGNPNAPERTGDLRQNDAHQEGRKMRAHGIKGGDDEVSGSGIENRIASKLADIGVKIGS